MAIEIFGIGDDNMLKSLGKVSASPMCFWREMEAYYMPSDPSRVERSMCEGDWNIMQPVWDLAFSKEVDFCQKVCMASTFDWFYCSSMHVDILLKAFIRCGMSPSSFHEQANIISYLKKDYAGFCWNQCTVNADAWLSDRTYEYCGELEPYEYHFLKDKKHIEMFHFLTSKGVEVCYE